MTQDLIPSLVHFCGMLSVIVSFALIATPQIMGSVRCYAIHSFLLAVITVLVALGSHVEHLMISAVLTVILKTIVIPRVFSRMIRRLGIRREIESSVNIPFSMLVAVILLFISFYVTSGIRGLEPVFSREFVPISVFTVFFAMLVMISCKKALLQVLGLLLLENGLFLLGITMTFGMPLLVELGIFFDALVAVFILGIFVLKIRGAFTGIDLDDLTSLKG